MTVDTAQVDLANGTARWTLKGKPGSFAASAAPIVG
jgi:hypothetical protein